MNENTNELIAYFSGLVLPETPFRITKQTATSNLHKCVTLSMELAKDGNKTSLIKLKRIRELLEKHSVDFCRNVRVQ
ncbi:DUF6965 family protein [Spirosoma radiotolerans]|uniref:DUF6965 domain-containing protein n=1 Tax=Spirosoma radiotolerans TaxID=1379870 RepID=A0A0E3ZYV1_9BACT|nr:hypothetical protein [Spirosoma radiotolerans]AKD57040.1 hypothetical protein SD10_21225 [Spirosoma radiotolerans]